MPDIIDLIYADHDWFRRQFFLLDAATTDAERAAVWGPLGDRLDVHAEAEETIFYPALLKLGRKRDQDADDIADETDDAIGDHNKIRDAVREAREHRVGTKAWFEAVQTAREENGEHLEEEEREGMTTFIQGTGAEQRAELAMEWLKFWAQHEKYVKIDDADKDPQHYIEQHA